MNSWPFYEIKRQIEYKAAWEGVQVITLTKEETKGTTMDCPRCGERLQVPIRGDEKHHRQLWCEVCKRWRDRDVCAVLNISRRGRLRFDRSQRKEGEAGEAMKGNAEHDREPLILRVDARSCAMDNERGGTKSSKASGVTVVIPAEIWQPLAEIRSQLDALCPGAPTPVEEALREIIAHYKRCPRAQDEAEDFCERAKAWKQKR